MEQVSWQLVTVLDIFMCGHLRKIVHLGKLISVHLWGIQTQLKISSGPLMSHMSSHHALWIRGPPTLQFIFFSLSCCCLQVCPLP